MQLKSRFDLHSPRSGF